jgi:pimeloyl-ACP methyl ester carboxylesterase
MPIFERRTGFATAYGIYYETAGQGEWVVLLHAEQADARMWDGQFQALAQQYAVLRYDFQGYGRSKLTTNQVDHLADMVQVLDTLGVQQCHLVGASMGGRIALDFALKYHGRVSTLTLLSPQLSGYTPTPPPATNLNIEQATEESLKKWCDGVGRTASEVNPQVRRLLYQMQKMNLQAEKYAPRRELPPAEPAAPRLQQLKPPTLVIVGELAQPEAINLTAQLASHIPHARKAIIPDTAHFPNMEQPELFNQLLRQFWAGISEQ